MPRRAAGNGGEQHDGDGTAIPFDPDQNVGDGTDAFTYDMITAVSEKFMDNDVDPDEPKIFVVSPAMARKLLQTTEFISGDYNARRPLTEKGYIDNHMGYSWVTSEHLHVDEEGEVHDLTVRSFGIVKAADTPPIDIVIDRSDARPVNGSDAVFAAVALAVWRHHDFAPSWPLG